MKIVNKKRFIKTITTIILTIVSIILINMFFNDLQVNGLGSLFTSNFKEVFAEVSETDLFIINMFRWIGIAGIAGYCLIALDCEAQLAELEKEERNYFRKMVNVNV